MALLFHDSGKPDVAWKGEDGYDHYYAMPDKELERRTADGQFTKLLSLHDHETIGAAIAEKALTRLNAPADLRRDVTTLVKRHMLPLHQNIKPFKVRMWRSELGDALLRDLITHRLADVVGKGGDIAEAVEVLQWIEKQRMTAVHNGVPTNAKGLEIGGHDLMALGLEGKDIGRVQKQLLHEVIAQPKLNEREWLLKRAEALA
jgi:tRNA nucleotidyltransferase (CCA-adding enzyme)